MLTPGLSVLYLHGFASSPLSRKATFLRERFAELGIRFDAPDLAGGDFFHLTISNQLEVVRGAADGVRPLLIIGSSLGGYLAALYAAERKDLDHVILLAPAFGFHDLWMDRLGPEEVGRWRHSGKLSVFHYGTGGEADLSYDFLEDAERYPAYPDCQTPTLIFHATHDDLVPLANSARFAGEHKQVELIEVNSGHELTNVLEEVWDRTRRLLPGA